MDKELMAKDEWQNLGLDFSEDEKQAEQLPEKKDR
jgi:hypothetical protein